MSLLECAWSEADADDDSDERDDGDAVERDDGDGDAVVGRETTPMPAADTAAPRSALPSVHGPGVSGRRRVRSASFRRVIAVSGLKFEDERSALLARRIVARSPSKQAAAASAARCAPTAGAPSPRGYQSVVRRRTEPSTAEQPQCP